jgi:dsRNA-specific ribonuclease
VIKLFGLWPQITDFTTSSYPNINNPKRDELIQKRCTLLQLPIPAVIPSNYPPFLERLAKSNLEENIEKKNNSLFSNKTLMIGKIIRCVHNANDMDIPITMTKQEAVFNIFGYKFENLVLLEEALTHCSITQTTNNQRLEFLGNSFFSILLFNYFYNFNLFLILGDAVLDFSIVSMLFKSQNWAKEGDLTQQKTTATNNKFLSLFSARLKLHYLLEYSSSPLKDEINILINIDQEYEKHDIINNYDITCQYDGRYDCVKIPKPLADLFEALIGAIFIDCNGNMSIISQVVSHIHILPQLNK